MALPNAHLLNILEEAYRPCTEFEGRCTSMKWAPKEGHVPRGFLGATGQISEVELVLVVAEPGDPQPKESYGADQPPRKLLESVCEFVYESFAQGQDLFHRNLRSIIDRCFPGVGLQAQLRKTWITESVLCSAEKEGGHVPANACRACGSLYLERQLELLSDPVIGALGNKAQDRLGKYVSHLSPDDFVNAYSVAPPGCNFEGAEESWNEIARQVRRNSE